MEVSPTLGGQLVLIARSEFKKLVYDSKFTKQPEGMSFVNSKQEPGSPPKYHADSTKHQEAKPATFPRGGL